MSGAGRSEQLDGLRGVAILMVFLHHSGVHLPHYADWGQMGVRLFFVLSGYLITLSFWKIMDRAGAAGTGAVGEMGMFHLRRIARLGPAFVAALAFGLLVGLEDVTGPFWWHATFLTNFKIASQGWFFGPTGHWWSLALQEQFYVVWPFILLAVPRRFFPLAAVLLLATGYAYRTWCVAAGIGDHWRWLMVPGSIDTFAIGGLLAWVRRERGLPPLPARPWALVVLALLGAAWFANRWLRAEGGGVWLAGVPELLEGMVAAAAVWGAVRGFHGAAGAVLAWGPLCRLGGISYGVFVYHLMLMFVCEPWLARVGIGPERSPVAWVVVMFVITVCVAAASWRWLERPAVSASRQWVARFAARAA
jgi:peptidoglycan/LPS O-acetylase OafA/YrhL